MLRWLYFLPAAAWAGEIFFLSVAPNLELPKISFFEADKLAHFGGYALLAGLLIGGWKFFSGHRAPHHAWRWAALALGFGATMEIVQGTLVPYRVFDLYDIVANSLGALAAAGAWELGRKMLAGREA
jgi:VanZ family protein